MKVINKLKPILLRLTAPFFFSIVIILAVTYCPLKWLLTGKYMISTNNKFNKFMYNWGENLGF